MKKTFIILNLLFMVNLFGTILFAQDHEPYKYALVIGNGNYDNLSRLSNPVNDANDIAAVLLYLGFQVEKVLNGNMNQMEDAVMRLKDRLGDSKDSYGFFFYAGHGVQSGGENFLIPVDANIPGENYLRNRAVSVQTILDELNDASNYLNVIVLDACRDNPFGWSRSGSRGLSIVGRQPADSIVVYATSAGQTASDGPGRNGLFTSQLLTNLATPGIDVAEVFRRTGADVAQVSNREQIPAIYNQFFGTAYLGGNPGGITVPARPAPLPFPIRTGVQKTRDPKTIHPWSIGGLVGSTFTTPMVTLAVTGTIPMPFVPYTFWGLGIDVGLADRYSKSEKYWSLYPFAHYNFFWPFLDGKIKPYIGAGIGFMTASYYFSKDTVRSNLVAFDAVLGVKLFNIADVVYSLRAGKNGVAGRFAIGAYYQFGK